MLSPKRKFTARKPGFTPAPVPLRRKPTLVPIEEPEQPRRFTVVRRAIAFAVVVGVSVAVVASASGTQAFKSATAGAQGWFAVQTVAVAEAWDRHLAQGRVVDHLVAMTRERDALALDVMELRAVQREHGRLVMLLDMAEARGLSGVAGRVIARPTSGRATLRIDSGATVGVALGQAVVAHDGLIGQVVDVGPEWADVLLARDPLHSTAVVIDGTEVHGTLTGTGTQLLVDHIIAGTDVQPGAIVLTSGEGDVYPIGITVGTVDYVSRSTGPLLHIELTPASQPALLAEVFVVRHQRAPAL
ncbi:MAG: rod shape-determining protein MreC [Myxococcota bacterium]|jgi:rod shape-determining protein MreC